MLAMAWFLTEGYEYVAAVDFFSGLGSTRFKFSIVAFVV